MSGINRGSKHTFPEYYNNSNGAEMLERRHLKALSEQAKRETCQCRQPVRLRKYGGQWVCVCSRPIK